MPPGSVRAPRFDRAERLFQPAKQVILTCFGAVYSSGLSAEIPSHLVLLQCVMDYRALSGAPAHRLR
jgi:hypothetical protein